MIKNNYFTDNEDIQDYFQTLIDWDEIVYEVEHDFRDYKEYSQTKQEELEFAPSNTQEAVEAYKAFWTRQVKFAVVIYLKSLLSWTRRD